MLRDGASRVLGRHPRAVVADPDQGHPTVLDLDLDSARPRVERVLDQLLDGGRGTLDDLPGGDPVRYLGRQHSDPSRIVGGLFRDQRRKELHLISPGKVFDAFGFEAGQNLTGPVGDLGR